jgi:hypothetical protein
MVEIEEIDDRMLVSRSQPFKWLLGTFIKPARVMQEVANSDRATWLLPMVLLTILTIASVLIAGPLRREAAIRNAAAPPQHFQYMSPEQQQQWMAAQESMNGPAMTHLFPGVGAVVGLWLSWFLLAAILHLVLTLLGSRSTNTSIYNLTAWASLPFAIRLVVQIAAMLIVQRLITSPGISGFVAASASQVTLFFQSLLRMIDFYLFWQIALLLVGTAATSGLSRKKVFGGVIGSVILLLALSALPAFLAAQFGGMNVSQPFIFY